MEIYSWAAVLQAVIITACTVYMRRGSAKDRDRVITSTAAQSTSNDILTRVKALETDLALVKKATVQIDDRGPGRQS